ncbi:MAG: hypothetical protein KatS3mg110_1177 [Pirellulaceae bacterium]|nr:MAG: hypothetical protein KatS3mg110_1177 [Pirellulaceae bacterium]
MSRIFLTLSFLALVLIGINLVLGFAIGPLHEAARRYVEAQRALQRVQVAAQVDRQERERAEEAVQQASGDYRPIRARYGLHMLVGIAAALVAVLVNSISITYFVGTSRWCREVIEAYGLSDEFLRRSQRLKRRAFAWAVSAMLLVVLLVALGGASDPAANLSSGDAFVFWHRIVAIITFLFMAWSFWAQLGLITANHSVIEEVMLEVHRVQEATAAATERASSE